MDCPVVSKDFQIPGHSCCWIGRPTIFALTTGLHGVSQLGGSGVVNIKIQQRVSRWQWGWAFGRVEGMDIVLRNGMEWNVQNKHWNHGPSFLPEFGNQNGGSQRYSPGERLESFSREYEKSEREGEKNQPRTLISGIHWNNPVRAK